jgi:hypothetical protein
MHLTILGILDKHLKLDLGCIIDLTTSVVLRVLVCKFVTRCHLTILILSLVGLRKRLVHVDFIFKTKKL